MNDLFAQLFRAGHSSPPPPPPREEVISVPLEQMFHGCTKTLTIRRTKRCLACQGVGGSHIACGICHGSGKVGRTVQHGPLTQRIVQQCGGCQGRGRTVTTACATCSGQGLVPDQREVQIEIRAGLQEAHRFAFQGLGDETAQSTTAADLVIVVKSQPHATFKRNGIHLSCTVAVTLYQALTGISFALDHLDGKTYRMIFPSKRLPCQPGTTVVLPGWGMPSPKGRGDLTLQFDIQFPANVSATLQEQLAQIWPRDQRNQYDPTKGEPVTLPSPKR